MGKINLHKIVSSEFAELPGAPGKSRVITSKGRGGTDLDSELYGLPGIISVPDEDDIGLSIDLGENRVTISTYDYSFDVELNPGEVFIYSRKDGERKSSIHLKDTGEIVCGNENGIFSLKDNGQFDANGNFKVDP